MTHHHPTLASRLAAVTTLLIGLLLVPPMLAGPSTTVLLLEGVGLVVSVVAATAIWLTNSFESRFFAVLLSLAVLGGVVLTLTLGMPGASGPEELNAVRVLMFSACGLLVVLLLVDSRLRRAQRQSARRPYPL